MTLLNRDRGTAFGRLCGVDVNRRETGVGQVPAISSVSSIEISGTRPNSVPPSVKSSRDTEVDVSYGLTDRHSVTLPKRNSGPSVAAVTLRFRQLDRFLVVENGRMHNLGQARSATSELCANLKRRS